MKNIQQYTVLELPDVPYIPGVNQRKTVTHQIERLPLVALSTLPPKSNTLFLFGVDLFNFGYYWEAHEAWEELWHAETESLVRRTLQGLIQMTAGFVKVRQENIKGVTALFTAAFNKIDPILCVELELVIDDVYSVLQQGGNGVTFDNDAVQTLFKKAWIGLV